jgi:hypothetical protein
MISAKIALLGGATAYASGARVWLSGLLFTQMSSSLGSSFKKN